MTFESGFVPENQWPAIIVPLYKGNGVRNERSSYRGIYLLFVVGKIYACIVVDRVRKLTEGFD